MRTLPSLKFTVRLQGVIHHLLEVTLEDGTRLVLNIDPPKCGCCCSCGWPKPCPSIEGHLP